MDSAGERRSRSPPTIAAIMDISNRVSRKCNFREGGRPTPGFYEDELSTTGGAMMVTCDPNE